MKAALQRTYPVILEKDEDGFYVAINPSLEGCYSQGKTVEEALANIQEATELCLEAVSDEEREAVPATAVSVHLITA